MSKAKPVQRKARQRWEVSLVVTQDCKDDMTSDQFRQWLLEKFYVCDYGKVRIEHVGRLPDGKGK